MKSAFKIIIIIIALVLLGGIMAYLAGFFEPKIAVDFSGVVPAGDSGEEYTVGVAVELLIEQAAGTIRAKVETVISPLITATISSIAVRSGDTAERGDVLVELDARQLNARVDQALQAVVAAEAQLKQVEKNSARVQRIYKADPGAISTAELDRTQTALQTTRADLMRARRQVDQTRTALSYSKLTAPISGRVVERYSDPGDTARQGTPLLRMYDPASLRLEASVRESVASKLEKGQKLSVRIDALEQNLSGEVEEIVPSADPGSRSFLVKVYLENSSGLYPGMFGRLLVPIGEVEKVYIPAGAVTRVGQLDFVIVKTTQGPVRRYVRLGDTGPHDQVDVISGLVPGERILISSKK